MHQNEEIPCARSEPADIEDVAISRLLEYAGELARWQHRGESETCSELPSRIGSLLDLVSRDGELAEFLETLPQSLGSGLLLPTIFRSLFPAEPQPIAVPRMESGPPRLAPRELQILGAIAEGKSRNQIARELSLEVSTVRSYFDSIFEKLEATSSLDAAARGAALGLVPFDPVDLVRPVADGRALDFNHFSYLLVGRETLLQGGEDTVSLWRQRLAAVGLLLFLFAAALQYPPVSRAAMAVTSHQHGYVLEYTPEGKLVHRFNAGGQLRYPRALAVCPPAGEYHGFAKGNLFVLDNGSGPDWLNPSSVTETTTTGEYVRSFTGGRYLSNRLTADFGLAFTADGRLLAASGDMTDAILEFTEGGRAVRRFANLVPYGGVATDRKGHVYVAGGRWDRNPVHVFSAGGRLLRTVGNGDGSAIGVGAYKGVAVDHLGSLYVANLENRVIEVYDGRGRLTRCIGQGLLHYPSYMALSSDGRLYVLDDASVDGAELHNTGRRTVQVFDSSGGGFLYSFTAPPRIRFTNLTIGPTGNLLIAGYRE